jgi:hypothetical protein
VGDAIRHVRIALDAATDRMLNILELLIHIRMHSADLPRNNPDLLSLSGLQPGRQTGVLGEAL